jgi:hypothetical protein
MRSRANQLRASPTLRDAPKMMPGYYAAFILDPDGNNIEAVFRES